MSEPRCPVCAIDLVAGDPGQHTCTKCRGTWIERAAFDQLMQALGGSAAVTPFAARARSCPACGGAMAAGTVFEVLVDRCADHGVWADAGELSRIVLATRRRVTR